LLVTAQIYNRSIHSEAVEYKKMLKTMDRECQI
jgi:hypothetical protein